MSAPLPSIIGSALWSPVIVRLRHKAGLLRVGLSREHFEEQGIAFTFATGAVDVQDCLRHSISRPLNVFVFLLRVFPFVAVEAPSLEELRVLT